MGNHDCRELSHFYSKLAVALDIVWVQAAEVLADLAVKLPHELHKANLLLACLVPLIFSDTATADEETVSAAELAQF